MKNLHSNQDFISYGKAPFKNMRESITIKCPIFFTERWGVMYGGESLLPIHDIYVLIWEEVRPK